MHAVHHRQQRVGSTMHHQCRHLQTIKQIDPTAFGKARQQLPLHAGRIESTVIGDFGLVQQHRTIIHHTGAAQRSQQIGLLLQGHLPARRLATCQQVQQRRTRCRQPLSA